MPSFKKQDYISKIYILQLYKMQEKLFKIEASKTDINVSKTIREKKFTFISFFFLCVVA